MHINGRGHRPLTSPFSWGRGTGLCESGFNDPIVDLCHVPSYSMYSLSYIPPHSVHMTPTWLHVCFLNTQLLRMWDLDSNKGRKCCLSPLLPASCCLVSLFSTPHICFNLLSHHVLSSDSPAPLQTLSVLCLPPFKLHFFKRGLIAHKAKAGEDSTSEQNP